MRRFSPAALAALFTAWLCSGCALLQRDAHTAADAPTGPPAPPMVQLVVDAPGDLRTLLEANLDLARLRQLPGRDALSDIELARLIGAAPAQVRSLLETEGYFEAEVQVRREPAEPGQTPRVHVSVQPGPRVQVDRVTFEVEGDLEREARRGDARAQAVLNKLRNNWRLPAGLPFRNPRWAEAKSGALADLRGEGYATATWAGTGAQVDVEAGTARLFVVADSGPLFRAGPLEIRGLERQGEVSVRNLSGLQPGTPLTEQRLTEFQDRLQASGLFESASVVPDADPAHAAAAPVRVSVRELPLQTLTAGVGYSSLAGPRMSLEHRLRRVFDLPLTMRNRIEVGRDREALEGELSTHAKADFWRDYAGYSLRREDTDSDDVRSGALRLGRRQDTPRRDRLYFLEWQAARREAAGVNERASAVSLNHHWVLRRLDNPVLPTRGYTLSAQAAVGLARGVAEVTRPFSRLYGRLTGYHPLGGWYGQARLELGQVLVAEDVDVPDPLRFRAGGDDSVRGYGYRSLAPTANGSLIGGKALFTTSLEIARPITPRLPALWGALFIDAGRAARSFGELKPAVGSGVGLRWRSPVGPLKLDLAWANETRKPRLHLSVGIVL